MSTGMICKAKEDKHRRFPEFKMSNNNLTVYNKVRHLEHLITEQKKVNAYTD